MNCCIVIGPVKSGTTLLISLLDSHPELTLFPMEVKFFSHWFERLQSTVSGYKQLNEFFLNKSKIRFMAGKEEAKADIMNSGRIDFDSFDYDLFCKKMIGLEQKDELSRLSGDDLFRKYLIDIHAQVANVSGGECGELIVSKEGNHGLKHIDNIRNMFRDLKYVVVVRDPRDIYASLKTISKKKRDGVYAPSFKDNISPCQFVYGNKKKNVSAFSNLFDMKNSACDRYFVRYEDLVSNPSTVMKGVANYLGVSYLSLLCNPSNFGNLWEGNASSTEHLDMISQQRIGKWRKELSNAEIRILEYFLGKYLEAGKYEFNFSKISRFRIAIDIAATQIRVIKSDWSQPLHTVFHICKSLILLMYGVYCCYFNKCQLGR